MEKNGKAFSSKRKNNTSIRKYFVTYFIEKDELTLECCTTAYIIVYFRTKSIQVAAFNRFHYQLMKVTEAQDLDPVNPKKNTEDKVSKHHHKAASNAEYVHK